MSTPGRLAIMPRPGGGDWLEDEIQHWRDIGIDVVVSMLTPDEVADMDLAKEQAFCERAGIAFIPFPIVDRGVPTSRSSVASLATDLARRLSEGKNIAIHCRQGLGRAAVIAACVLIMTGVEANSALKRLSESRGCSVPETTEQQRWVLEFEKRLIAPPVN